MKCSVMPFRVMSLSVKHFVVTSIYRVSRQLSDSRNLPISPVPNKRAFRLIPHRVRLLNSRVMINLQNQSAKFFRTFLADYILLIYMSIQFILVNKPPLCDPSIKRYDRLKILLKFWLSPGLCSNWPS